MSEVNLVKRWMMLSVVCVGALSLLACTREKPLDVPPPAAAQALTPLATPLVLTTGTPLPLVTTPLPTRESPTPAPTLPVTVTVPPITPTATRTPTFAPTVTPSPIPGTAITYTVQWGDWLRKIADRHNVTLEALLAANPGINPNVIYPGQRLTIPAPGSAPATPIGPGTEPTTYTVQRGEWLSQIARKFGLTSAQLLAANPGINPNLLYPGQVLRIPARATPVPGNVTPTPGAGGTINYTVRPGDTLYAIALRFKTTPLALQMANHLANPHAIYPGMVLVIPAP